jgi:hypothetical protein
VGGFLNLAFAVQTLRLGASVVFPRLHDKVTTEDTGGCPEKNFKLNTTNPWMVLTLYARFRYPFAFC